MFEKKPLYQLPTLQEHQEWACEHGCSNVKPMLYRNVYCQSWDTEGNLTEELAEHFYTCGRKHLLMVWDNTLSDYAEIPDIYYQEKKNHESV
ncbi:hypothetical protein [Acinetobacter colistiniresistens]|uniref:hypothetical protein n=1 Tax=Acinetobacter colistiniresistens TaxID=280145 RepID=UPI0012506256|nr:hypothetical protein [Acinetobacter colistiniresistens]